MTERPVGTDLTVTLENPRADRIKKVHALTGRSARMKSGTFLAEGPQAVREAVRYWPEYVRELYVSPGAHAKNPEIHAEALARGIRVFVGTDDVLDAISADAQGVLAVVGTREETLPDDMSFVVVCVDIRDPGNLGTIIRTADAAGVDALILAGDCVEATNPKVVRATAGSLFHVSVVKAAKAVTVISDLKDRGLLALAAAGGGSAPLVGAGSPRLSGDVAWVLGNEARGLPSDILDAADHAVQIPIFGNAESLNVASAAAVVMYSTAFERQKLP